MRKYPISEGQQFPDGTKTWPSEYRYVGHDSSSGLHIFEIDGKRELFARRTSVAGWHLIRGAFKFEFCRSIFSRREQWY